MKYTEQEELGGFSMAKMDKKWILLCSTAVAAVYATGYFSTEAQANKLNAPISVQASAVNSSLTPANNNQASGQQVSDNSSNGSQGSSTQTASSGQTSSSQSTASQTKSMYKNGTFTGTGMNRRGSISVNVTIQNDKITDVQISDWGMHYSESDVVGLPSEVIQYQSAQVQNVSGATYSTAAFADAVQEALNQAHNA